MARPRITFEMNPKEWTDVFTRYVQETRMDAKTAFKKKAVSISFALLADHRKLRGRILRAIDAVAKPGNAIRIRSKIKTQQANRLSKAEQSARTKAARLAAMINKESKSARRTKNSLEKMQATIKRLRGESTVTDFLGRETTDERNRELMARRRSAGFIAAKSWKLQGQTLDDLAPTDKKSKIRKKMDPDNLGLEIENTRPNMGDFVRKTKYTQQTLDNEVADMLYKIRQTIEKRLTK
jgi:hypothetical protein